MMRAMECWYMCGEPIIFRALQDVLGQCRSGLLQSSIFAKPILLHSMEDRSSSEADLHASVSLLVAQNVVSSLMNSGVGSQCRVW